LVSHLAEIYSQGWLATLPGASLPWRGRTGPDRVGLGPELAFRSGRADATGSDRCRRRSFARTQLCEIENESTFPPACGSPSAAGGWIQELAGATSSILTANTDSDLINI